MCVNQIYSLIGNASPYAKLINFIMKNDFVSMKKHRLPVVNHGSNTLIELFLSFQ